MSRDHRGAAKGVLLPLLGSFLCLAVPALYGAVIGFLLLEERDAGTLAALHVSPLNEKLRYDLTMGLWSVNNLRGLEALSGEKRVAADG